MRMIVPVWAGDGEIALTVHHQDGIGRGGEDSLVGHRLVALEPGRGVDAPGEADDAFGLGPLAPGHHPAALEREDEEDALRRFDGGGAGLGGRKLRFDLGGERLAFGGQVECGGDGLDLGGDPGGVGGLGDEDEGDAGGLQHLHRLGRACVAFADDQRRVKRQHVLGRQGADIADIGQRLHALRPGRGGVAGDQPVFRTQGNGDLGDGTAESDDPARVLRGGGGDEAEGDGKGADHASASSSRGSPRTSAFQGSAGVSLR
jgi:hypothetical protein